MERTELFACAESLGGVESLVNHPAIMTHASVPIERRAASKPPRRRTVTMPPKPSIWRAASACCGCEDSPG